MDGEGEGIEALAEEAEDDEAERSEDLPGMDAPVLDKQRSMAEVLRELKDEDSDESFEKIEDSQELSSEIFKPEPTVMIPQKCGAGSMT